MKRSEIAKLKNLGGKTERWLNDVGIFTLEDLKRLGSIEVYRLLRQNGFSATLNLVYGIEGAMTDTDWRELPLELKAELKQGIEGL